MTSQEIDRRQAPRYTMEVPVELLFDNGYRQRVISRDVSATGLFVTVSKSLKVGVYLRFLVTFPQVITTSCKLLAVCDGTVVRKELQGELEGLAVKIDKYQFLSSISG